MSIPWEKIPIFAGLTPEALELLTQKAKSSIAAAGDFVVREGEAGNRMFIIRSGSVRVWKSKGDASQVEIARLSSGDFFGEMCILETLPRAATIEALEESGLCALSSMAFYDFYRAMPDQYSILVLNIARDLSRRLRRLDQIYAAKS
jgi:CRP/FNR family transcriptional regulator, cyclic AMP receptor protein